MHARTILGIIDLSNHLHFHVHDRRAIMAQETEKTLKTDLKAAPYKIRPDFPVYIYPTYGLFQQLNLVLVFKAAF